MGTKRWKVKKKTTECLLFKDLFIFLPFCRRLIQSVEIPSWAWLIEILIMHHHQHCEIGHNIKLLWLDFMASWISERKWSGAGNQFWERREHRSSLWAASMYSPPPPPVDYLTTVIDEGFVNTITKFHHIEDWRALLLQGRLRGQEPTREHTSNCSQESH